MTAFSGSAFAKALTRAFQRALVVAPFLSLALGLAACCVGLALDHVWLGGALFVAGTWLGIKSLPLASLAQARSNYEISAETDWYALGRTSGEREQAIARLFERREPSAERVHVSVLWPYNEGCVVFRVGRDLAEMPRREREGLHAAFRLFNAGVIDRASFDYFRFAFIYADGKGQLEDWCSGGFDEPRAAQFGATLPGEYCRRERASVAQGLSRITGLLTPQYGTVGSALLDELHRRFHGAGAWLAPNEVPHSVFADSSPQAVRLGVFVNSQTMLEYSGHGSLSTIAPLGSGKTQCFVIPNLLCWRGAALVLDPNGESYAATAGWRAENIGPVYRFDPLNPGRSHHYNPLASIREAPAARWQDARQLAEMLLLPSDRADSFFENRARELLAGAVAHSCWLRAPQARPFSRLFDLTSGDGWDELVTALKSQPDVADMRQLGRSLENMKRKTREKALRIAHAALSPWQSERVAQLTTRSDWRAQDLRSGKPTIYLCLPPHEIDALQPLLRVLIAQHIRALTCEARASGAAPATLMILDELPRLRHLPLAEALAASEQSGLRMWLFARSYRQLRVAYPNADSLLAGCAVRTFMNVPRNDELAEKLSDQLGYREDRQDGTQVKLVEPFELAGPGYRDQILVLSQDSKPAKLRKRYAFDDPALIAKRNVAVPALSAERAPAPR